MIIRKIILLPAAFMYCLFAAGQAPSSNAGSVPVAATHKTKILLLGVYHFDNPNQDQFNVKSDNVLSEKRQKEMEELVRQLARFKPTKIALEFDKQRNLGDSLYQQYLAGQRSLSSSEAEQIGFRLAKYLGHKHIYAVDERRLELDFDPGPLAQEFGPLLEELSKTGNGIVNQINQWVSQYSIGGVLSRLNQPEMDKLNLDIYYRFLLPIGKDSLQPGADAVTSWYKRNLYIFHHIKELLRNNPDERILVIFGQGHTAMLKQFLQYSTEFEVFDIQQYLPKQ